MSDINVNISPDEAIEIVRRLKDFNGAMSYDGDCSVQVIFKLEGGGTLRFGITDADCIDHPGLWIDQYGGLTPAEQTFFSTSESRI